MDEFPEKFAGEVPVFHLSGEDPSAYEDVIKYLTEKTYPFRLSREEKMVFQTKLAPLS